MCILSEKNFQTDRQWSGVDFQKFKSRAHDHYAQLLRQLLKKYGMDFKMASGPIYLITDHVCHFLVQKLPKNFNGILGGGLEERRVPSQ